MTGEGFDYCWRSYSDFEEMKGKDFEEFHRLRKQYIEAADALENLVKSKIGD
jgi:hypothetical protein